MSDELVIAPPTIPTPIALVQDVPAAEVPNTAPPKVSDWKDRDVLAEVLADPSRQAISGQTGARYEPVVINKPAEVVSTTTASAAPVSTDTAPVVSTATATSDPAGEKKLYAGKFETVEAMEEAYKNAEKMAHQKAQEAADARRKALEPPAKQQTPEEIQAAKDARLAKMIDDPDSVVREARQQLEKQLADERRAAETTDQWRKENADIAPYELYIGYEMQRLIAADPKNADMEPAALLTQATTNFRAAHSAIRESGKKEALQVSQSVTPLAASQIRVAPPTEQPKPAPISDATAAANHLAMLQKENDRVRGVRR